jgi:large conductance mechanosensitive channel protein
LHPGNTAPDLYPTSRRQAHGVHDRIQGVCRQGQCRRSGGRCDHRRRLRQDRRLGGDRPDHALVGLAIGGLDFSNYFIQLSGTPAATLAEAKKAGAVFAYGNFLTVLLNFVILAFIIFMMVRQINRLRKANEPAPAPAPEPVTPEDVLLLREIRDALKR